jgi:DNA-binding MarR family transcriptional regulator
MTKSKTGNGVHLAQLLIGSYRALVDAAIADLETAGIHDFRPVHEFAMQAIASGTDSASELSRSLSVSKQAAAKTIKTLLDRGYITREADPSDSRRKRLIVTPLGFEVIRKGELIFDALRDKWAKQIGGDELAGIERQLGMLVGQALLQIDTPGWIASTTE